MGRSGQGAEPDVAVAHRAPVVLEIERTDACLITKGCSGGRALDGHMILDDYAVMEDGECPARGFFPIFITSGRMEDDVVALPDAGGTAGIYQWGILPINCAALAVGIGLILE